MFTGLVSDVGEVVAVEAREGGMRFRIATAIPRARLPLGASVACGGPCLTVVEAREEPGRTVFATDVSSETLARTTLGGWRAGTRVNLEPSLRIGDELGGHLVTGHIDGVATVAQRQESGGMARFEFDAPAPLARFVAEKGSVCLDGTSLTVNGVDGARFRVMLIPHTLAVTTWGDRAVGDPVNLEIDLLARYVARLQEGV